MQQRQTTVYLGNTRITPIQSYAEHYLECPGFSDPIKDPDIVRLGMGSVRSAKTTEYCLRIACMHVSQKTHLMTIQKKK